MSIIKYMFLKLRKKNLYFPPNTLEETMQECLQHVHVEQEHAGDLGVTMLLTLQCQKKQYFLGQDLREYTTGKLSTISYMSWHS